MAIPKIVADLETSLAAKIAVGGTTGTIVSNTDDDGVTLADGTYYFTIDGNNSAKEHIKCTKTGTALSDIYSVSRQGVETSGVVREHRVGAKVIMTDYATYKNYFTESVANFVSKTGDETIAGVKTFSSSPIVPTPTTDMQASTKKYVDDNAVAVTGDETIAGVKTFSSSPIVPTPTTDTQASNKAYSDTKIPKTDIDTDTTLAADSDTKVASQKATKAYADGIAIAGGTNASETVRGVVEEATQAEMAAKTETGATGARLFVNPKLFINESQKDATPANDEGKVVKLESDGKLSGVFLRYEFGDGSDGDVTISTPTTLTRDMYYNNLTVNSTLTTDGYRIYVKNTIAGSGTIKWGTPNNGGDGGKSNVQGAGGAQSGSGFLKNTAGVASQTYNTASLSAITGTLGPAGVKGGLGTGNLASTPTGIADGAPAVSPKGNLSMKFLLLRGSYLNNDNTLVELRPNGSSAGRGGAQSGQSTSTYGGGGGSGATGGTILIVAQKFTGTFTIESIGGNGGNGYNSTYDGGGGGGGNGGNAIVVFLEKTWTGSYTLTGGTGGTNGGGSGSAGENGNNGTSYEINIGNII